MAKLPKKQERFVDEYLIDLNQTQAAIRAGYSAKSASEIGYQLLQKTSVSEEIAKRMAARSVRTGINQDRVVLELARIALVNPDKVINTEDASVKQEASVDDLACIQKVKVKIMEGDKGRSEEREVIMYDKIRALDLLGRHLGMFKDKVEVSGMDEKKDKLREIIKQLRGDG